MAETNEGLAWEIVKVVGSEEEATVVVGFLNNCGIPAEVESLHSSEFPTEVGALSNVRVRVPAERAQEATALLNQRENVATGDDGAQAGAPLESGAGTAAGGSMGAGSGGGLTGDGLGDGLGETSETTYDAIDLVPEEGGERR